QIVTDVGRAIVLVVAVRGHGARSTAENLLPATNTGAAAIVAGARVAVVASRTVGEAGGDALIAGLVARRDLASAEPGAVAVTSRACHARARNTAVVHGAVLAVGASGAVRERQMDAANCRIAAVDGAAVVVVARRRRARLAGAGIAALGAVARIAVVAL